VALSAAGGQVKKIDKVQELADSAKATRAFRYYRSARTRFVSAPASRLGSKLTRRVSARVDIDGSPVVRKTLSGAQTVGQSLSLARRVGNTPKRVLRGLNDRGQAQLRAYYRGIRGTTGLSNTGLDPLTVGGRAEFREALNDRAISGRVLAQFRRGTDDRTWRELFDRDVCNSPCESTIRSVYQYTKQPDGLSNDEAKDLLNAYAEADEVSIGPGSRGSATVQQRIDELADSDVDGVTDAMADISASTSGYKQIAGETEAARGILDGNDGIDGSDIELNDGYSGLSGGPNAKTDIDVNVEGEITVDGTVLDSPSIESKNYNPNKYSNFLVRQESNDLIDKFVTQAESRVDKDSFVLVTTDEYLDRLETLGETSRIRDAVQQRTSADVEIEFTTYSELEN
jgi:hypothetical protein